MKSRIKIEDYNRMELAEAEGALRRQGYRLVRKISESDLLPQEYIRQEFSRSMNSSGDQRKWTLRWREC